MRYWCGNKCRLVAKGALRLVERSKAGHIVEVRLPEEICGARDRIEPLHATGRAHPPRRILRRSISCKAPPCSARSTRARAEPASIA
jgi:hypothetical protein